MSSNVESNRPPKAQAISSRGVGSYVGLVIVLGILGALVAQWSNLPAPPAFHVQDQPAAQDMLRGQSSLYRVRQVSDGVTAEVHSASVVEIENGILSAVWYGGTREGSRDTVIMQATLNLHDKAPQPRSQNSTSDEEVTATNGDSAQGGFSSWSASHAIASRELAQKDLSRYIKKLGNPVITKDSYGRVWLFYVTVSVGGWAGSSIAVMYSDDNGQTWGPSRRIVSSPFINISTLVKSKPFYYEDGTMGLPVYHEFIGKFPEIIRIDKNGELLGKQRLWWARGALQPLVVPVSEDDAVVFLRSARTKLNRILRKEIQRHSKENVVPEAVSLFNPNSGLSALRRADGSLLMVFNNSPDQRNILSLAYSEDNGQQWAVIHDFENESKMRANRFGYPTLIQSKGGSYHMLYTWKRTHIKHVEFNDVWLEGLLK